MSLRVLHSFPHKIGAGRICMTAWHEVAGAADAGAAITVLPTAVARPLPPSVQVQPTLALGRWRIPRRVLGERALTLHDRIVARRLPKLAGQIDLVHAWPLGSLETLRTARRLGIPTVLERPNAHTRLAYEVVARESERLGVSLPPDHEHAYNAARLAREEAEYRLADRLLCPSEFVVETFREHGFADTSLTRHTYGYNESVYYADTAQPKPRDGLNALFVGVCAVRKGVHYALEAWLRSPASRTGRFRIAGEFVPEYQAVLGDMLRHPSVEVLGHSDDVPALMRDSDILLLPSIEEGFGLVVVEAMASGCVPLVSEACTEVPEHGRTGLRHLVGDVDAITEQITLLHEDRARLAQLRAACLAVAPEHTWSAAGVRLFEAYREVLAELSGADALVA
ncbi:MAG: glycosyltransferase family 4 protein [Solirubrobacterales bacterium]|nr:glycosyltransferase family 4 protein [Solirubrobacterales bacterium]